MNKTFVWHEPSGKIELRDEHHALVAEFLPDDALYDRIVSLLKRWAEARTREGYTVWRSGAGESKCWLNAVYEADKIYAVAVDLVYRERIACSTH